MGSIRILIPKRSGLARRQLVSFGIRASIFIILLFNLNQAYRGFGWYFQSIDRFYEATILNQTPSFLPPVSVSIESIPNQTQTTSLHPVSVSIEAANVPNETQTPISLPSPRPHPHAGARYPNGTWGYIADPTRVRRWMIQRYRESNETMPLDRFMPLHMNHSEYVCGLALGDDATREKNWTIWTKVQVDAPTPGTDERTPTTGKILCVVYTYHGNHQRLDNIIDTWGWRCDGFFAASTATIETPGISGFGAIDLAHHGPEEYNNMWQKTRSIMGYLYDHYQDDYDYFYVCGDDTHLIVSNLRNYLGHLELSRNASEPLFLGQLMNAMGGLYVGGGGGYVLNQSALRKLVNESLPQCAAGRISSAEDRLISKCLMSLGIFPTDAADTFGAQRFHSMDPPYIQNFREDGRDRYFQKAFDYWRSQGHNYTVGSGLVSTQSISFHLLRYTGWMMRHHAILYRSCPEGSPLAESLALIDNATIN